MTATILPAQTATGSPSHAAAHRGDAWGPDHHLDDRHPASRKTPGCLNDVPRSEVPAKLFQQGNMSYVMNRPRARRPSATGGMPRRLAITRLVHFEDANLERHGYSLRYLRAFQPIVSGAEFFVTIPALPDLMGRRRLPAMFIRWANIEQATACRIRSSTRPGRRSADLPRPARPSDWSSSYREVGGSWNVWEIVGCGRVQRRPTRENACFWWVFVALDHTLQGTPATLSLYFFPNASRITNVCCRKRQKRWASD